MCLTLAVIDPEDPDVPPRSEVHHRVWVELKKTFGDGFVGILKTQPAHALPMKDGSVFEKGREIYFESRHVFERRENASDE